jgi:hypothetical protein
MVLVLCCVDRDRMADSRLLLLFVIEYLSLSS